jgi:hypothetical protein
MTKSKLGATYAAAVLSLTLASAQTTAPQSSQTASAQTNRGRTPDRRAPDQSLPNSDAAKSPQTATISGCVVRDAANGGQATIASNGISYKLTGKRDKEFEPYLGKRVEVTGMLASGSTGARATSGKTSEARPPKDQTATAGQSDVPATDTPRDNTTPGVQDGTRRDAVPLATDKGTTADLTGIMQVKTIRMVAPSCL